MAASGVYELKSQRTNEQTCNKHITARDSVLCLLFDKKKRTFIWLVLWDIPIEMLLHFIANQFPILLLFFHSQYIRTKFRLAFSLLLVLLCVLFIYVTALVHISKSKDRNQRAQNE